MGALSQFARLRAMLPTSVLAWVIIAQASLLRADDGDWNSTTGGNWNVDTNWTGAAFPNATGDTATLGNAISADSTITLGQDITIRNLVVDDDNRYTVSGANTLILNRNGTTFTQSGAGGVTINSNVQIIEDTTWNGDGAGTAIFNGVVSEDGSSNEINKRGSYTLILNGNNTFSGGLLANAGVIEFGNNGAAGTGTLNLSGGTVQAGGGARSLNNAITISAASTIGGANDLTFSGAATLTGNRTLTVDNTGATTFSGVISGAGDRLTKDGAGLLILSGNNTYSDGLRLNAGTVEFGHDGANGTGTLTLNAGTIRAGGGARSIDEAVTVGGDFTVGGANNLTLSGAMALGASNRTVTVDNTGNTTFSGVVSGSGGLVKAGNGVLILSSASANTFTGATTVSGGTLNVATSGALGGTSSVTIGSGGTLLLSGASTTRINDVAGITLDGGTLDQNGGTETMGVLTMLADSTISLGGSGALTFANTAWSGSGLTITGWTGLNYGPSTAGKIFFSSSMSNQILSGITFSGFQSGAYVLSTGEVVPVPEPAPLIAGLLVVGMFGLRMWISGRRKTVVA